MTKPTKPLCISPQPSAPDLLLLCRFLEIVPTFCPCGCASILEAYREGWGETKTRALPRWAESYDAIVPVINKLYLKATVPQWYRFLGHVGDQCGLNVNSPALLAPPLVLFNALVATLREHKELLPPLLQPLCDGVPPEVKQP